MSQTELADKVEAGKGYISELVNGKKYPSLEMLMQIADALDVEASELFEPTRRVPVVGRVGAGASVVLCDAFERGDGLYHVVPPPDLPAKGIVAVEVEGDSMTPLIEDGDILFFTREFFGIDEQAVGHVAICETDGDLALVKKILPGREPGTYDLHSANDGHPPMYGMRLKWAAPLRRHLRREDVARAV